MNIYIFRHGQTDLNKEGRAQGLRCGKPLNAEGIRQCKTLRESFGKTNFAEVFSSARERTVQSAEIVCGRKPVIDERIEVYDLGTADGLKKEEIKYIIGGGLDPKFHSGFEDISSFVKRVFEFVRFVLQNFKQGDNIAVFGHKCTTGCISAFFEGIPKDGNFLKLACPNGACKILKVPENLLQNK